MTVTILCSATPSMFPELFSRESRPGWDGWGHEAGKFDEVTA